MSVIRVTIGVVPAALLAIPLYHYSIFDMGLPLVAFLVVLMAMGWALGLAICGGILRHGMGAEGLAWTVIFAIAPLSCIYYPVTILPVWLQPVRLGAALDLCLRGHARGHVRGTVSAPITSSPRWPSTSSIWRSARRSSSSPSATPAAAARCCRWGNSACERSPRLRDCRATGRAPSSGPRCWCCRCRSGSMRCATGAATRRCCPLSCGSTLLHNPPAFILHTSFGGLALLLAPWQFVGWLRRRHPACPSLDRPRLCRLRADLGGRGLPGRARHDSPGRSPRPGLA